MTETASKSKKIWITTGGTGGHVYPALVLADCLKKHDHHVRLSTDRRGFKYIPESWHANTKILSAGGLFGKGIIDKIKNLFFLGLGFIQCLWHFILFRPSHVISFGSYAALPALILGVLTRRHIILHEQNAVAGNTTIYFARFAQKIATSFPNTKLLERFQSKITVTGNPIRVKSTYKHHPHDGQNNNANTNALSNETNKHRFNILVIGGSLGAKAFADYLPLLFNRLDDHKKSIISIKQQCRHDDLELLEKSYKKTGIHVELNTFFDPIHDAYLWADFIICRSGAGAVFELIHYKKPSLLIPFPHAIHDHQRLNAEFLCRHNAAMMMNEKELAIPSNQENLAKTLGEFIQNPEKLETIKKKFDIIKFMHAEQIMRDWCENDTIS